MKRKRRRRCHECNQLFEELNRDRLCKSCEEDSCQDEVENEDECNWGNCQAIEDDSDDDGRWEDQDEWEMNIDW